MADTSSISTGAAYRCALSFARGVVSGFGLIAATVLGALHSEAMAVALTLMALGLAGAWFWRASRRSGLGGMVGVASGVLGLAIPPTMIFLILISAAAKSRRVADIGFEPLRLFT